MTIRERKRQSQREMRRIYDILFSRKPPKHVIKANNKLIMNIVKKIQRKELK